MFLKKELNLRNLINNETSLQRRKYTGKATDCIPLTKEQMAIYPNGEHNSTKSLNLLVGFVMNLLIGVII